MTRDKILHMFRTAIGCSAIIRLASVLAWTIIPPAVSAVEAHCSGDTIMVDADFYAIPIPDEIFASMQGKSFKTNCTIPRSDLRYVTVKIIDANGTTKRGEMVVNKAIAKDIVEIFSELYNAGYPIERMELIDEYDANDTASMEANNSSAFNFRTITGQKRLSKHATGMAIDINTLYNPYVKRRANGTLFVSPESGRPYTDRSAEFPYKIISDDLAVRLFKAHGFTWGGDWNSLKDYQHFEK